MSRQYYVYILTNHSRTIYIGVTSDLKKRLYQHKNKVIGGFTGKYNIAQLVYYESTGDIHSALTREKQLKRWRRVKKIALIESVNPYWQELNI